MSKLEASQVPLFEDISAFRRVVVAESSCIWVGERMVLSYRGADIAERNLAMASLLGFGLKGRTVAELMGVGPAEVSRLRKGIREQGLQAAAMAGRRGRPERLVGKRLKRAKELRARGASQREIAAEMEVSQGTVCKALEGMAAGAALPEEQLRIEGDDGEIAVEETTTPRPPNPSRSSAETAPATGELAACEELPTGPAEHSSRYAGVLLLGGMMQAMGVPAALKQAGARRGLKGGYTEEQVMLALVSAWAAGYSSLEAMHEQDARSLGAALGLERSPSVRTLHRAIGQMTEELDPVMLNVALLRGVAGQGAKSPVFGIDGHFNAYTGAERIDKGWDTKKRIARKGLHDVYVTDVYGQVLWRQLVGAADGLHKHVLEVARAVRANIGREDPLTFAFDRGGFSFEVLNGLAADGFRYITYVPANVTMPALSEVAPEDDGLGERIWSRKPLNHEPRLLVQRDGEHLIPVVTNVPETLSATDVVDLLRSARGMQENGFKAARAFMNIDALNDRGGARRATDDRLVSNPQHKALSTQRDKERKRYVDLALQQPIEGERTTADISTEQLIANLNEALLDHELRSEPKKVAKNSLDPDAERAWLKTRNRALLLSLKLAADNARRRLVHQLGAALAPSERPHDQSTRSRTLVQLLRAHGSIRFTDEQVFVTIEMPLPPAPHQRLAAALEQLDALNLRAPDGRRLLRARLAERSSRQNLPHHQPTSGPEPVPQIAGS